MPEGFSRPAPGPTGVDLMSNPTIKKFVAEGKTPPPVAPPAPARTAPPAPEAAQVAPEEAEVQAPTKSPQEQYLERLKELDISMDEAAKIIDDMILGFAHEEDFVISKKLTVRFRTRAQEAADRLNTVITKENPSYNGVLYSLVAKFNLAASLVKFGPHTFDPSTPEGFDATMDYITRKVPLPVYQLLVTKLAKFDEKMSAVMQDGAVEHFF